MEGERVILRFEKIANVGLGQVSGIGKAGLLMDFGEIDRWRDARRRACADYEQHQRGEAELQS